MSDYYIGLMSGTSMDGIDAALVNLATDTPQLVSTWTQPWDEGIHSQLELLASNPDSPMSLLVDLHVETARHFADAALNVIKKADLSPKDIAAIGSHGQTVLHIPNTYSLQIGDPNRIAEYTGITTVCDFRNRDIAAGGQGAPLVPAFHRNIFQTDKESRVVVNIGGISNITILLDSINSEVTGFDTGPGNLLMNAWCQKHRNQPYDSEGNWARTGEINGPFLDQLLRDPYFSAPSPKSTGREYFNLKWLDNQLKAINNKINPVDVQATLTELTTQSITAAIKNMAPDCKRLLVCGGGVHNKCLMEKLDKAMNDRIVESTDLHGLHPDWVEATAFAWLAKQTLNNKPGSLPAVTGANHPTILGGVYHVI